MPIPRLRAVLAVLVVLAPLSCSEPIAPGGGLRVETSQSGVIPGAQFAYTVVNGTSEAAILAACCDLSVAVDRYAGQAWEEYRSPPGCVAICPGARVLQPGQRYGGVVSISDVGVYRLRLGRIVGGFVVWDVTSSEVYVGYII